jgi:hypothetical protein
MGDGLHATDYGLHEKLMERREKKLAKWSDDDKMEAMRLYSLNLN